MQSQEAEPGSRGSEQVREFASIAVSAVSVADGLEAKRSLVWIADRWPDLRARLRPPGSSAYDKPGSRVAPTSKPPLDLVISDLMFEVEEEARSLGHVLMDETDWTPRTSFMPGLLREVADQYGHWIASDDRTALAFMDWAEQYRSEVTRALEKPPAPAYIGPCTMPTGCDGEVRMRPHALVGVCRNCRAEYDVLERMAWVQEQLEARIMTLSEIVSALLVLGHDVPLSTLTTWANRKRLTPETGRLYHLADALRLAEERSRRK